MRLTDGDRMILNKLAFLRLDDWFFKHASVLVSILFISLESGQMNSAALLATMIFSISSYSYAFGLNYYIERDADAIVGKNRVAMLQPWEARAILSGLAMVLFAVPFVMHSLPGLAIALSYFFMATAYSLPPFYFKASGWFSTVSQGIFLVSPHLWMYLALVGIPNPVLAAYLSLWTGLITLKGATIHQILDYENDRQLGWRTLAVTYGPAAAIRFTNWIVLALYILALAALILFIFPINVILLLTIGTSNGKYRPKKAA